ncbi:MAG TPA: pyridoxamine 5'-phosphate oxidase family protein [Acidimicrobiales bacterium]|nr:pyridoxamine 5'-phosphate oxidase family protein [Acidimicrobiales bacterium]
MADLSAFSELIPLDHGLCVLSTKRADGSVAASVVNAGVLRHPLTDVPVVGFVARGLRKLDNLRNDPRTTVVARVGWQWAAVEGQAEVFGPDDPHPEVDDERLRLLLREVFVAAGGTHEDWREYDRVMLEERSAAVLVVPRRTYANPA